jgi:hypothetical protein
LDVQGDLLPWGRGLDGAAIEYAYFDLILAIPRPERQIMSACLFEGSIQVAIRQTIEESPNWTAVTKLHGDLWSIIKSIIRPYGLVGDDNGLFLKIDQLEGMGDAQFMFPLTSSFKQALMFLGLLLDPFPGEPFEKVDDMFEFVSQCPMFCSRKGYPQNLRTGKPTREQARLDELALQMQPAALQEFTRVFRPDCCTAGRFKQPRTSPKKMVLEALQSFGVEEQVRLQVTQSIRDSEREFISIYLINAAIPEVSDDADLRARCYRIRQIVALEEIILEGEKKYGIVPATSLFDKNGWYRMHEIKEFIRENKVKVGDLAFQFHFSWYEEVARRWAEEREEEAVPQDLESTTEEIFREE